MNKFYRIVRYDWPMHFVLLLTNWLPDNIVFLRFRGFLASFFFKKCGRDLRLGRNLTFYNPSMISLGSKVYIAYNNWFCAGGLIEIDDEVMFGPSNIIVSTSHQIHDSSFRYGDQPLLPIKVGRGAWITSQCIINGGVEIGSGVLLAANSVANGKLINKGVYGGSPAKLLKEG